MYLPTPRAVPQEKGGPADRVRLQCGSGCGTDGVKMRNGTDMGLKCGTDMGLKCGTEWIWG
jgi:hypothetical protein